MTAGRDTDAGAVSDPGPKQADLLTAGQATPKASSRHPAASTDGHRLRMRERLLTGGADALADHELLEMALFLAVPRSDTKPVAKRLLARFGSFANVVSAAPPELVAVDGMGQAGAAALKLVQAAALRLVRAEVADRPVLSNWDALMAYLNAAMARERTEQVRILFLDSRNRLLADEVANRGTVNHAPVYPREVVRRALELQAAAIIVAHNHPSGDPTPSQDDIAMTQRIVDAAAALSIAVHDHVIIGNGRWLSLRALGLLTG